MWDKLLKASNAIVHVAATGAGAGLQQMLWSIPGSSSYLSGCTFPYSAEEQEELLGFMPEHFCSEEAAVDLASAAYMKAHKFGGKKAIGIGLAAAVASDREHKGDLRVFVSGVTDDKVVLASHTFEKGVGADKRAEDGKWCDEFGMAAILECLATKEQPYLHNVQFSDASKMALERFMERPFFAANGKRMDWLPEGRYAIYPGAYNPPHEGHFGVAEAVMNDYKYNTVFEVTATPPHKDALTVQQLLQRAKLLQGHGRIFTEKLPFYVDKALKFKKLPMVLGADAMVRMLDPKWGLDIGEMLNQFYDYGTKLFIAGREIDGNMTTCENILDDIKAKFPFKVWATAQIIMKPLKGEWNISSTEIRNKQL